ncbi:DUF4132 domain-containing protein, partial [Actinoplanes sp. NPDC049596]
EPGAAAVLARCDRPSLAAYGHKLLDDWLTADMPAAGAWMLLAQAHLGDDSTWDRLAPLLKSWPARSRWLRAIDGYAVLATAGTDAALRHLIAIEEGMSGGPMTDRARTYLTQAAARRGLSVTQLADRLAVTHGLDEGVTLDYGPRAFAVRTDEHLVPYVVGADGRRLARPPKPGVRDTDPGGYERFVRLKKDLKASAAAQIARLERDMLRHRRRPAGDLAAVVLPHLVLGPIARRLLWAEYDTGGRVLRALRIAEDGTFADVHETTATVAPDVLLGLVHPAELAPGELAGWVQIFADYEILQPFPQVHRPAVALTERQRAATSLAVAKPVPSDRIVDLRTRSWHGNGFNAPGRVHTQMNHLLPGGLDLVVELEPGVTMSVPNAADEQRITEIWADDADSGHWQRARRIPMGSCDAAALSELLVALDATMELL